MPWLLLEPFGMGNITITNQGFGWLDIVVKGQAAHGCAPELGIDAIAHMAEVITRLQKLDREKYTPTAHPFNGIKRFFIQEQSSGHRLCDISW
jgi:acetylornithine deacetylase